MDKFKIRLNATSIVRTKLGTVGGEIFVQVGDFHFPEVGWWDMPVAVLLQWGEVLSTAKNTDQIDLVFFDGPYRLRLMRVSPANWRVNFMEGGKSIHFTAILCLQDFIREYIVVADELLQTFTSQVWERSEEVRKIAQLKTVLSAVLFKHPNH